MIDDVSAVCVSPAAPMTRKTRKLITATGIVIGSWNFTLSNISTSAAPAITLGVSDSGDIPSPITAAHKIALAAIYGFIPIPAATPISATPIVPQVPKLVPVKQAHIRVTRKAVAIKYFGLMTFSPIEVI